MSFAEDLAPFVDTADFGEAAAYNGGDAINVIFDTEYQAIDVGTRGAESRQLRVLAVSTDVPNAAQGDTFVIDGETYVANEVHPDPPEAGPGFTMFMVTKQ